MTIWQPLGIAMLSWVGLTAAVSGQPASQQPDRLPPHSSSQPKEMKTPIDESFLLFPAIHPEGNWNPPRLDFQNVWFQSDDHVKLHAWYCPLNTPTATIVYFHGNAGNLSHRADVILRLQQEMNCSVFIFDYRGYGRSQGTPAIRGILKDAQAAVQKAAQTSQTPIDDLIFLGRSMGAAIALETAVNTGPSAPRSLILESTFTSFRDIAKHHAPKLGWLVPPGKLNSIQSIAKYKGRLVLSHSVEDEVIPFEMGQQLFEAGNAPKTLIKLDRGGHNDPLPNHYYQRLKRIVEKLK